MAENQDQHAELNPESQKRQEEPNLSAQELSEDEQVGAQAVTAGGFSATADTAGVVAVAKRHQAQKQRAAGEDIVAGNLNMTRADAKADGYRGYAPAGRGYDGVDTIIHPNV